MEKRKASRNDRRRNPEVKGLANQTLMQGYLGKYSKWQCGIDNLEDGWLLCFSRQEKPASLLQRP